MTFQERLDRGMADYLTSSASAEVEKALATVNLHPAVHEWVRALALMCYALGQHDAYADVRAQLLDFSIGD